MFELSLGVVLAIVFVAAYLLVSKLFKDDPPELSGKETYTALNQSGAAERAFDAEQSSGLFLPEQTERKDVA